MKYEMRVGSKSEQYFIYRLLSNHNVIIITLGKRIVLTISEKETP